MEESREQLRRNQQALADLTRLLSEQDRRFEETVADVLELGCSYLDLDVGFLARIEQEQGRFEVRQVRGEHPEIESGRTSDLSQTYCRRTIEQDGLLGVDDALAEGWAGDPAYERYELACYLGGTVTVDGKQYGTLCFGSRETRERTFTDSERTFVELVVEWIGDELEHAERQTALDEEQRFVETVFESLEDAVFVLDTDGRLTRWNQEVASVTGYDDATLSEMDISRLFDAEDIDGLTEAIGTVLDTGRVRFEADIVTADDERVPLEFRAARLTRSDGTVYGICGVGRDVSERRAREQRLREYRRTMENVRGMVYALDADGRISLATPGLADRLGYDLEELRGTHVGEIVEDETVATANTDVGPESTVAETTLRTRDGRSIPVRIDVQRQHTAGSVVGTVRDVTELAAAKRQLDDERSRFQYLFDTIPDPANEVEFQSAEPVIRAVNDAFEDVFGFDEAELIGRSNNEVIVPPDSMTEARAVDERVLRQGPTSVELRRETADGLRDFLFRGIPYADDEDGVRAFGIYTDITEQKRRERYLQILARIVRHNLRNKLDVIMGNAEWVAEHTEAETREQVERIVDAASDLESVSATAQQIERLLDQELPRGAVVDASDLLETLEADLRTEWSGLNLGVQAPDSLPVQADDRLRIALAELVENAIEHGSPDGDPGSAAVDVTANPAGADGWVTITVADDGPGIPETERWVVTGETEITQLSHSRGLGLWLVTWIVESFGGDLQITTGDNGSVVTVRLRAAEDDE